MANLYEHYNTGDDSFVLLAGDTWNAQTFTPSISHRITSVKIKVYRYGTIGTVTVSIRATNIAGRPILPDLCSGTIVGSTITTDSAGEWREISLGVGYELEAGTKYAIVVRAEDGLPANALYWRLDSSSPTYTNGNYEISITAGGSWSAITTWDFMFEEWGEPIIVVPTVTTNPATDVEATSATLNGSLDDDGGEACDCSFEYGLTTGYGTNTAPQSKTTGQTFSQAISSLLPNRTYHFRAIATNSAGTSYGADETFSTLVATPTVTTDVATSVGTTSATLNGTLDDDGGEACECGFEYGKTDAYGETTPTDSKTTGQSFSQVIVDLDPDATYHFRAIAINSAGTSYGTDRTFATEALPPVIIIPTVTTEPASDIETEAASLNGLLDDDGGEACDCGFEWGETAAYGNTTSTSSKVTGQTFQEAISGLSPGETYHFRAFATNIAGTGYGADETFETLPIILPAVTTDEASSIEQTAAILNGTLDDDGREACACGFEWGKSSGYGETTSTSSKETGESFAEAISGLKAGNTYHFRAFATNSAGTAYGADETLTTLPAAPLAYLGDIHIDQLKYQHTERMRQLV